jgi:hypothetical protein
VSPFQRKSWPERHGEGLAEVHSGCALHGVLKYNGAARGQSLKGSSYETRNPENIQDTCTGKFSAKESGVQFGHCAAEGKVDRTRPLCPYPQVAKYKGTGSTDDASNFACALP